jgi:pimeloyl-ACP methyl ester carboxylesterase
MIMQSEITGKGSTVVPPPGGLTGWLSWKPHAELLCTQRKVVRVQLLNVQYGLDHRDLPADYSVRMESRALGATLDRVPVEKQCDLVAWSFGAEISLDFAPTHPQRVRTLTLIEPPAFWAFGDGGLPDPETDRVISVLGTHHGDISEAQLETFAKTVGLLTPSQSGGELPVWPVWMEHRYSIRNSMATIAHRDDPARLRTFSPPVLLVKGTGSAPFLHRIVDTLARQLPHAEVLELPGGHAPRSSPWNHSSRGSLLSSDASDSLDCRPGPFPVCISGEYSAC